MVHRSPNTFATNWHQFFYGELTNVIICNTGCLMQNNVGIKIGINSLYIRKSAIFENVYFINRLILNNVYWKQISLS